MLMNSEKSKRKRFEIGDLVSYANSLTGNWVGVIVSTKRIVGHKKKIGIPRPGMYYLVSFPNSQRLALMQEDQLNLVEKSQ